MRRDDDRLAQAAREAGDRLLQARHLFERHFDAEVAARHHEGVGDRDDFVEPRDGLRLLDLGHHMGAAGDDFLHFDDVLRPLDEGERDPIDILLERGGEIVAVLFGHRRCRDRGVGQAHALLVGDAARDLDDGVGAAGRDRAHAQHHLAVVDKDAVTGRQRGQDFRMGEVDARLPSRRRVRVEREGVAVAQLNAAAVEFADAQLRSLQVNENADRPPDFLLERADHRDAFAHRVMRGVAHVDPEDVGAGGEKRGKRLAVLRGRAEGRDDLHAAGAVVLQGVPPRVGRSGGVPSAPYFSRLAPK